MLLHALVYTLLAAPDAPAVDTATPWDSFEPATSLVAAPGPALAETKKGFSYTYAEINYKWLDADEGDQEFDGVEVKGSFEILLNIFLQASYATLEDDVDLDRYRFGAGYHLPIGDRLDLFGILSYAKDEVDGNGIDEDDDGVQGELGARFWLLDRVEINGEAIWANVDDSDFGIGVGARWYPIDLLSVGLGVETFDGDETFTAGLRAQL
jgi:hypothetical protein